VGDADELQRELLARIREKVDRDPTESEALFTKCAWCGKVRAGDGWADVADENLPVARTSHGICPDCLEMLRSSGKSRR
jgi:hypothetical protein